MGALIRFIDVATRVVVISAAGLLCACGSPTASTTSPTASTTSPTAATKAEEVAKWREGAIPAADRIGDALGWISGAASSGDYRDTRAACRELNHAAEDLRKRLPSPDPELTAENEAAVTDFIEASRLCIASGPDTPQATWDKIRDDLREGDEHMGKAVDILNSYEE